MTTLYVKDSYGEYKPATTKTIIAESAKLAKAKIKGRKLDEVDKSINYLYSIFAHLEHEVFGVLFLDNQHHVIQYEEMFRGTINGASVYPREVVKQSLAHNAAAVIFAHNHPSGFAEPSSADIDLTNKLKKALNLIDIRTLDHIIIAHGESYSLAQNGFM
jgi:DNA repair protein RadC